MAKPIRRLTEGTNMLQSLIALGIFGGVVWMITHAIFLLMKGDAGTMMSESRDGFKRFVEENYGSRFLPEQGLHRL